RSSPATRLPSNVMLLRRRDRQLGGKYLERLEGNALAGLVRSDNRIAQRSGRVIGRDGPGERPERIRGILRRMIAEMQVERASVGQFCHDAGQVVRLHFLARRRVDDARTEDDGVLLLELVRLDAGSAQD